MLANAKTHVLTAVPCILSQRTMKLILYFMQVLPPKMIFKFSQRHHAERYDTVTYDIVLVTEYSGSFTGHQAVYKHWNRLTVVIILL